MGYFVEAGRSITVKGGVAGEHTEITKGMILGEKVEERLKQLVKTGHLYEADVSKPVKAAAAVKAAADKVAKAAESKGK